MDLEDEPLPDFWDPTAAGREYYRSRSTGDRGYIVRRDGREMVRLDRPMQEILFPKTGEWALDEEATLLVPMQAVQIAFAADRQVCLAVGLHGDARVTWQDMSDEKRVAFAKKGPEDGEHPIRGAVYEALKAAMRPFVR